MTRQPIARPSADKPSRAGATGEKCSALWRERYFDLKAQHFHEKRQAEHEIELRSPGSAEVLFVVPKRDLERIFQVQFEPNVNRDCTRAFKL